MKRLIITHEDDVTPDRALSAALTVVYEGFISESAGRPHYCWHTSFGDGIEVSVRRKDNDQAADSFHVYHGSHHG